MEKYMLDPGDRITVKGEKIEVQESTLVGGTLIPKKDETQKTYLLKAICPKCKRIIRVTDKNWKSTEARVAIVCMHSDGEGLNFVLDSQEIE